jgi:hypothetical protein
MNETQELGTMAHSYNSATQEAEIWRITVRSQPRQKALETPSQPIKSWTDKSWLHRKHKQEDHGPD